MGMRLKSGKANFMVLGHNVVINCSELVQVRELNGMKPSTKAFNRSILYLIPCKDMTQLQAKMLPYFQFLGHNVSIDCSELLGAKTK